MGMTAEITDTERTIIKSLDEFPGEENFDAVRAMTDEDAIGVATIMDSLFSRGLVYRESLDGKVYPTSAGTHAAWEGWSA